jgi:hypothetical protein
MREQQLKELFVCVASIPIISRIRLKDNRVSATSDSQQLRALQSRGLLESVFRMLKGILADFGGVFFQRAKGSWVIGFVLKDVSRAHISTTTSSAFWTSRPCSHWQPSPCHEQKGQLSLNRGTNTGGASWFWFFHSCLEL